MSSIFMWRNLGDDSKYGSSRNEDTLSVSYTLVGTTDRDTADLYALTNLPAIDGHRALYRGSVRVKELSNKRNGTWLVTAEYLGPTALQQEDEDNPQPDVQLVSIGFSVGGQSRLMTHSLETISSHLNPSILYPATPTDFQNQINVVNGSPEGAEINPPSMAESTLPIVQRVRTSLITNAWIASIENATGHTNNATFRGRAAGEILFWGLRGTYKPDEEFTDLTWEFLVAKNKTQTVGVFPGIAKKGWEFAWVYSEERENADDKTITNVPISIYIERLFPSTNLGGIGVQA